MLNSSRYPIQIDKNSSRYFTTPSARRFLQVFKTTNAELSKDLDEKSEKLAKPGVQFPSLLTSRAQAPETRIEVVCFYEGLSTTVSGRDIGVV